MDLGKKIIKTKRIHSPVILDICTEFRSNPSNDCQDISQRNDSATGKESPKSVAFNLKETMDVSTTFHCYPSDCCWHISVWIKEEDLSTDPQCHLLNNKNYNKSKTCQHRFFTSTKLAITNKLSIPSSLTSWSSVKNFRQLKTAQMLLLNSSPDILCCHFVSIPTWSLMLICWCWSLKT